jgi:hypothetical protein
VLLTLGASQTVFFVTLLAGFVLADVIRGGPLSPLPRSDVVYASAPLELVVLALTVVALVLLAFVFDTLIAYIALGFAAAVTLWNLIGGLRRGV